MRRENNRPKGPAVLRFFICLLLVMLVCAAGLMLINMGRGDGARPYVPTGTSAPGGAVPPPATVTAEPTSTGTPEPSPSPEMHALAPTDMDDGDAEDMTTEPPVHTAGTARAVYSDPTPEPTKIPKEQIAKPTKPSTDKKIKANDDGEIGISGCYVSEVDGFALMELTGWGYPRLEYFDGTKCETYLLISKNGSNDMALYKTELSPGISGMEHADAECRNPSDCDWRTVIDVRNYADGVYSMGLVLRYKNEKRTENRFYKFGELQSFTVKNGEIIMPVTPSSAG